MKQFLLLATVIGTLIASVSAQSIQEVTFRDKDSEHVEVLIGENVFAVMNHGKNWNKPFLFPVSAPDGTNILRDIIPTEKEQGSSKEGTDHFHHKGVWVSVDSVNDEKLNFWHEKAKIVSNKIEYATNQDHSGRLTIHNTWMQDDKPLLKETTMATFYPSRLVTYHIELAAIDKDVTVYDTKEGFFAVRIAHTMREMQGGHIVNAEGLKGEKECWGKPSPWIDYYGQVGDSTCGIALMDHPSNFRQSRYHVRSYGLFSISPFGPHAYSNKTEPASPVTISPDKEPLKLTYAMFVHNGDTETGKVADAYQQFLKVTEN